VLPSKKILKHELAEKKNEKVSLFSFCEFNHCSRQVFQFLVLGRMLLISIAETDFRKKDMFSHYLFLKLSENC